MNKTRIKRWLAILLLISTGLQASDTITIDTLSILSFNDFHGAFPKEIAYPGAASLVQEILNEKQKNKNTIVVSVGDNFSGSYFSHITKGEPLPEVFEAMGVEMSAIGNHEFDWGLDYLEQVSKTYLKPVSANITTDGVNTPDWLPPYKIVERQLKNGEKLRVAFIGLTTTETVNKTSPQNYEGLQFIHPLAAASAQTLYHLKKEGKIDLIVLLIHIGTDMKCTSIINEANAEILPYMEGIDAIISGHSHKVVLGKVHNVPIIQAGSNGTYIGKLSFQIRADKNNYDISFIGGDTIQVTAAPNPQIEQIIEKVMRDNTLSQTLTHADNTLYHNSKSDYTAVGAYVTASYVACFKKQAPKAYKGLPIIGINHYGGIRSHLYQGKITKLRAGNVLPFCGDLVAYKFTGKSLKKLLNDGRVNPNGYLQTSYLTLQLDPKDPNRIVKIYKDNTEITDDMACVVVLDTFITPGGDGYDKTLFEGNAIEAFNRKKIETTAAFIDYLGSPECQPAISAEKAPIPQIKGSK